MTEREYLGFSKVAAQNEDEFVEEFADFVVATAAKVRDRKSDQADDLLKVASALRSESASD